MIVDATTGAILSHEEKAKPVASFNEMLKGLDKQKEARDQLFSQELSSQKNRERLLEEKFQEAMKRADKDKDKPFINPLDVDWMLWNLSFGKLPPAQAWRIQIEKKFGFSQSSSAQADKALLLLSTRLLLVAID